MHLRLSSSARFHSGRGAFTRGCIRATFFPSSRKCRKASTSVAISSMLGLTSSIVTSKLILHSAKASRISSILERQFDSSRGESSNSGGMKSAIPAPLILRAGSISTKYRVARCILIRMSSSIPATHVTRAVTQPDDSAVSAK